MAKKKKTSKKKGPKAPEWLSPRLFAEQLGVTRQAVMKAIETGRLEESVKRTDRGWNLVDLERGRREWRAWTDPSKQRGARKTPGPGKKEDGTTPSMFDPDRTADREIARDLERNRVSHARASAEKILVEAELRRIDLDVRRGDLIDKRESTREQFVVARVIRDGLLSLPPRLASIVASMDDPGDCNRALQTEVDALLQQLVRHLEQLDEEEQS